MGVRKVYRDDRMKKCIAIIPARYESTRFPGKPLAPILGKTLLQRTYENALRCKVLQEIVVATDDERIFAHVRGFGGNVIMTSVSCETGTDRLAEVYANHTALHADIIINLQGDEPCVSPETIEKLVNLLSLDPQASMATAAVILNSAEEALSPHIVKCTIDQNQNALYFSRSLIPANKTGRFCPQSRYYKHLGIYGYRSDFLLEYARLPKSPLQISEDLEQLKALEYGYRIKVAIVNDNSIGVDVPEDIQKIEKLLCALNTSL